MVIVMDAISLEKLLQVDVSALDLACRHQDSAVAVCFGPAPPDHLLVSTASNTIVVLDTVSGRVVQKLPGASSGACSSLAVSGDARLLLTAACRAIKVWDYSMQAGPACQVYIGHSEPVQALAPTPNQQQLLSAGDAVFFWDILAPLRGRPQKVPVSRPGSSLPLRQMKKRSLSGVTALRGPIRPQAHPRWGRRPAQPETRPGGLPVSAAGSSISPAPGGGWLHLKAVVGYSGNGRANAVWGPDTGFFAYMCGCLVVVEDLHSGAQRHWPDHPKAISTLALSHDAQILASALGCSGSTPRGQIRIWDVPWGSSRQLASHHDAAMQALAFSPDDGLLVALGDYLDCTLALWSMATYELLSFTRLLEPVHGMAFNPWDAGELACVGPGAVTLWLLQQHGADISLQVHRDPIPEEVAAGTLTSVCYGTVPLLYGGSNTGQVCVWDMQAHRCFLAWEADDGEIGVLLCSGARLVSSNNTRRLRLWAVGAVPELRCRGSGARFGSVLRELELTLDGAIVSVVFHDSMDMGVVGTTAGTLWFISWAEGSSTHLISGHRSKVNEVVFSPSESHCATCCDDGSMRVWSLTSMELVIQLQVLNQSCFCLAWSPPSCGRPEQQRVAAGHSQTILSGDKDGLVAVSSPRTGVTFCVLSNHGGALISTIQSTSKEYGDFNVEGSDLWLATSADQHVSVWASDWVRNHCELVDWLSFPAPTLMESLGCPPRPLAAFCPWDGALLVCAGLDVHPEVVFYSLCHKQVVEMIPLPFSAMSLSLSPWAHLMAIGFAGRVLRLVDCESGSAQDLAGHSDSVWLCRSAPASRLLFTARNEILVWEVAGPRPAAGTVGSGVPCPYYRAPGWSRSSTEKPCWPWA